jgi:serine/threonine protein kinase
MNSMNDIGETSPLMVSPNCCHIIINVTLFVLARSFIRKCLALNPADRLTATEALNDVWMTGEHAKDINILDTVRENFNARRTFKSAVSAVKAMNRLRAHSLSKTATTPPLQANMHLHSEADISRVKSAQ